MSRVIDDLPPRDKHGSRPSKYPWDEWADGRAREITEGEDFEVTAASMAWMIRQYAHRNRRDVDVRVSGRSVLFQFARPEAP